MNHKLLTVCLLAGLAISLNACDDGEYNELKCDSNYVAECLDTTHMMVCENGQLNVKECQNGYYCTNYIKDATGIQYPGAASCVPAGNAPVDPVPTPTPNCNHAEPVCNGNSVETCINGEPFLTECKYGCENNACKTACTATVCKDANTLSVCNDGISTDQVCENGCENNACKADLDSCVTGTMRCSDSAMAVCADNVWIPTGMTCENGCNETGDDCAAPAAKTGCEGVTCDAGECIFGVCVTEEMKAVKDGDPCDYDSFVEFCNGDKMVYCTTDDNDNDVIVIEDCSLDGGCGVIDYAGDGSYMLTWCKGAESDCSEVGEKLFYCDSFDTDEGPADVESFEQCFESTDGALIAIDNLYLTGSAGFCSDSCNDTGDRCITLEEPYYCDFEQRCNDSSSYDYCYDMSIFGIYAGTEKCGANEQCVTIDGLDTCRTACETLGTVTNSCYIEEDEDFGDTVYAVTSVCSTATNGSLFNDDSFVECAHSCEGGECQMITENEGKACTDPSYGACVTDDIAEYCGEDYDGNQLYKALSCKEAYGDDTICAGEGDALTCATVCDTLDEETTVCENGWFSSSLMTYKCVEDERGLKFQKLVNETECNNGCSADGTACK